MGGWGSHQFDIKRPQIGTTDTAYDLRAWARTCVGLLRDHSLSSSTLPSPRPLSPGTQLYRVRDLVG